MGTIRISAAFIPYSRTKNAILRDFPIFHPLYAISHAEKGGKASFSLEYERDRLKLGQFIEEFEDL